jgi:hypothetical protein
MILLEIDDAIRKREAHVDLRISLEELEHDRQDVETPEYDRCGDDQLASGGAVLACCGALGFPDVIEDALARGYVGATGVGEDESSARPGDELCAQMRLQLSETFRLTVASGIPSLRDAPERLPASTAASNADMASSLSMHPSTVREDDSGF